MASAASYTQYSDSLSGLKGKNLREDTMFQLISDAHSKLSQVEYMGLLVYVEPCSASTTAMCERRGWGQYLGVEDNP